MAVRSKAGSTGIEKALVKLASQLSQYRLENPDVQLNVSCLFAVGMQSAGKTRLVSVFAGRLLGGAMKKKTGTRRPIVHVFENAEKESISVGEKAHTLKPMSDEQAFAAVKGYMDELENEEKAGGIGFKQDPIYVKIKGPETLDITFVDLPGVKPDEKDPANKPISQMIKHFANEPNAVPIVLTAFHQSLDLLYTKTELDRLVKIMDSPGATERAVVLVSRLDAIRQQAKAEMLQELTALLPQIGLPQERLCFLTLKPELLDGSVQDEDVDTDSPSFDFKKQDEYFRQIRMLDEKMIATFAATMPSSLNNMCLGIHQALQLLEEAQTDGLKHNFDLLRQQLIVHGSTLVAAVKTELAEDSNNAILARADTYVDLLVGALGAIASHDAAAWQARFKVVRDKYPSYVDNCNSEDLVKKLNLSFLEESQIMKEVVKASEEVVLDVKGKFSELRRKRHTLGDLMNYPVCGGAAVGRLTKLWTHSVMERHLKEFSAAEVYNYGQEGDRNMRRGISTDYVIRKMVNVLCEPLSNTLEPLCHWASQIYIRQAPATCKHLQGHVRLLDKCPMLQQYLDDELCNIYLKAFTELAESTFKEVARVLEVLFTTLKLDEMYSMIRLLGASQLSTCMLQQEGDCSGRQKNSWADDVLNVLPKDAAVATKKVLKLTTALAENIASSPANQVQHTFDFFTNFTEISVEDFAQADGMKLRQVDAADIKKFINEFNAMAHCIARFNTGMFTRYALNMIELLIKGKAEQLPADTIFPQIRAVVSKLREDEGKLAKLIHGNVGERKYRLEDLQGKLVKYIKTASSMNTCVNEGSPLRLSKVSGLETAEKYLDKLRKAIQKLDVTQDPAPDQDKAEEDNIDSDLEQEVVVAQVNATSPKERVTSALHPSYREKQYLDRIRLLESALERNVNGQQIHQRAKYLERENASLEELLAEKQEKVDDLMARVAELEATGTHKESASQETEQSKEICSFGGTSFYKDKADLRSELEKAKQDVAGEKRQGVDSVVDRRVASELPKHNADNMIANSGIQVDALDFHDVECVSSQKEEIAQIEHHQDDGPHP